LLNNFYIGVFNNFNTASKLIHVEYVWVLHRGSTQCMTSIPIHAMQKLGGMPLLA